jgi:hypothetical protein
LRARLESDVDELHHTLAGVEAARR